MTTSSLIFMILLQIILILINGVFSATELAVLQLDEDKLEEIYEDTKDPAAKKILKLIENPSDFLSTIQIGITLAGYLGSAFAADNFAGPLAQLVYNSGFDVFSFSTLNTLSLIFITIILSYFTLVFGELVPKRIGLQKSYAVAKFSCGLVSFLSVALKPVIRFLAVSTNGVLRLFGISASTEEDVVTEAEIRNMVRRGVKEGVMQENEKEMLDNVFELNDTIARDVMTHRVDVVSIEADALNDEVLAIIEESGLTRFPVYDDNLDNILGTLNTRDFLINLRNTSRPKTLRELLRPACFVPETVPSDVLLRDMQTRKNHLAIVLDEYGGMSGIVTMEDLIEEIVGNIYDEFDAPDEPELRKLGNDCWRVAGDLNIDTLAEEINIKIPEDRDYDTLGGLVFSQLSTIPQEGEEVHVEVYGLSIDTEPIEDHHVEWAKVCILPTEELTEETEKEEKK